MDDVFVTPPLLTVLCVLIGSASFFAPYLWVFRVVKRGRVDVSLSFVVAVHITSVVLSVSVLSFLHGLYSGVWLWFEAGVVLCFVLGCLIYRCVKGDFGLRSLLRMVRAWLVVNFCVLGCLIVSLMIMALLFSVFDWLNVQAGVLFLNPLRDATLVTGVVLIAALFAVFSYICRHISIEFSFHHVLWPLVLGLFFLMGPLLIQNIMNSEEFRKEKPVVNRYERV